MTTDPRIPAVEECVLGHQLERWAAATPDEVALLFSDGQTWTWAQALQKVRRAAKAFRDLGVVKGDHVLSWQPNSADAVLTWFALNYLGAVYVPMNTAFKGRVLEQLVALSDASVIVCHVDLVSRLAEVDTAALTDMIVTGRSGGGGAVPDLAVHPASTLAPEVGLDAMPDPVEPWDTQYIIFTSGTTGPSKAVLSSYLHSYTAGPEANRDNIGGDDRLLINLPLFHVGGTVFTVVALATGGSCYIDTHFKTDSFWATIEEQGITFTCLLAAMIPFLLNLPAFEGEGQQSLRKAMVVPWNEDAIAMVDRYSLQAWTAFNMTEINAPLVSEFSPTALGTCGKLREGTEARVVDANDCEVANGTVGELILRSDRPWGINHGYYKNPEATAAAWRNGWFHTGDAFRRDDDGNYFFVDRIKDTIRRRGENISSFEVEAEVSMHPDVAEVAAVAVPSELGEDEVMVVVSPNEGADLDPAELLEFLVPRMAHFMVPRYVQIVKQLPKTPTQKVQKFELKQQGVTADTWDREAAGMQIRRDQIG